MRFRKKKGFRKELNRLHKNTNATKPGQICSIVALIVIQSFLMDYVDALL